MKVDPDIQIRCTKSVYEPAEDSFMLIEMINLRKGQTVLDMGTGSGIVGLHCASLGAIVTSSDINPHAVRCAKENAKLNKIDLKVVKSDLFDNITGMFDIIAFNPPYLPSGDDNADDIAWTGGASGIEILKRFFIFAKDHVEDDGAVYTIVSSLAKQGDEFGFIERDVYSVKKISKKELFFETLYGLKITI